MTNLVIIATYNIHDKKYLYSPASFLVNGLKIYFNNIFFIPPVEWKPPIIERARRRLIRYYYSAIKYNYRFDSDKIIIYKNALAYQKILDNYQYDAILSWNNTFEFGFINTNKPIFIRRDAVYPSLFDAYGGFYKLRDRDKKKAIRLEQNGFNKANTIYFSSNWAISEFNKYYEIKKDITLKKIGVAANLRNVPAFEDKTSSSVNRQLNFLILVSKDSWARKGGNKAIEIINKLNNMGYSSKLYLCGDIPDEIQIVNLGNNLILVPYINKENPKEYELLQNLLLRTDFLLLPTKADFTPNVIAEANAFGIPVLVSGIAGISEMVINGENGYVFPVDASSQEYVDKIVEIVGSEIVFRKLRLGSRKKYDADMNWNHLCEEIASDIHLVIDNKSKSLS